jgi:hypothetical protein
MTTGSVYLNCEFVVLDGPYAKRKMWSLIGLHSPKGPEWANMGRAFVKGILNSSRGLHPQDNSPQAQQARRIQSKLFWSSAELKSFQVVIIGLLLQYWFGFR